MDAFEHDLDMPRGYTGTEIVAIILGALMVSAVITMLLGG